MSTNDARAKLKALWDRLTPDELRVLNTTTVYPDEEWLKICTRLGMADQVARPLLRSALDKADAVYAEHDAAVARRSGRLQ